MSHEDFATRQEKVYFNFCYALQNENKIIREYIKNIGKLFTKLEREMKKITKNKAISHLETFLIADQCFIGYHKILKKVTNPKIIEYCLGNYKLARDARVIIGHLLPSLTIEELIEKSKKYLYKNNKFVL